MRWTADGFKVVESSAKPNGHEIGIRGKDQSGRLTFLAFLFLVPDQASLTSAKCRDGALEPEKKANPTLRILGVSDSVHGGTLPVSLVNYTARDRSGKTAYMVRGFVATGDICGDLEFYSDTSISAEDTDLKRILGSYQLDENCDPKFNDVLLYAQILYKGQMYKGAAPIFEIALRKLRENPGIDTKTMRRVVTDQAGMAYGCRETFRRLARSSREQLRKTQSTRCITTTLRARMLKRKTLPEARSHLQEAFARKANVIPGESMPDPTKDDSFLPYRNNKDFWSFLESLNQRR